jgi:4-amino-4-deoxy-L-arabinose transferase-like glycosyltransferase
MRAAERRWAWPLAVAALVLAAFGLRLWGFRQGLPYVYNADENAHFVAGAIGMFGHTYNPNYFINPPAFTYLLHVAFALGFGGRAGVSSSYATDPTNVFALARALSGVLGALAVGLLAWAGARLFDRRIGLVAAALLAVAFLPVHYAHFALNDVPTLAPLCLALVGVGGVFTRARLLDYAVAGVGLGLACATKYTGGIMLLPLVAAALVGPGEAKPVTSRQARQTGRRRIGGLALAGALALAAFLVANPFAVLDFSSFREGLSEQSAASSDGGGKLGLTASSGILYYLGTTTWGLGWLPALASLGGAIVLAVRDWRRALVLVPAIVVFVLFMGTQDRYFARWLLPVYPLAALLAAYGALAALAWLRRPALAAAVAGVLLCAQGLVYAVHNDVVLARADTRQVARDWMVEHVPAGSRVVIEPVMPDSWASDPGTALRGTTGNGARWAKWPTSRSRLKADGRPRKGGLGPIVKLEDYERTLFPQLVKQYADRGYCTVLTGSTQFGRALAEPEKVPLAIKYYDELKRDGRLVFAERQPVKTFSFDFSFNSYPLSFDRPGPEIAIYRLHGGKCGAR